MSAEQNFLYCIFYGILSHIFEVVNRDDVAGNNIYITKYLIL